MRIKKGSRVTFHYELRDDKGELLDSTFGGDPVIYIQGEGEIIVGLEELMEGEEAGFEAKVTLPPEKAYGVANKDLIVFAGPENFDDNVEIEVGSTVETEDPDGETIIFRIIEVDEDKVYLDGNHPLADKTLDYKIEVLEVH
ncbi:FKBP-type peptidyl-prolyl cis-trans isomerase [Thiomicrorhabdus sediminis]|uniref:Peptidyl-prolyl cis-trans isomerase n=1 Tax=Thiomicrorhabdus sediminis TaxID=2580412 RepID=A0A4P9K5T3_9GAMM|nr:FKBP-type peptidyl-prolyl cis-trans isomerase [Thiomicrorhabdus sediminis]QCU90365.1 peptidylprolyl isomerase [Thiomicrorhabdus sediminis]